MDIQRYDIDCMNKTNVKVFLNFPEFSCSRVFP